jgi:hypothetical protein
MHRLLWRFWIVLAAFTGGTLEAQAANITYSFMSYPSLQSGYYLYGTITTNGKIGPLAGTDVVAWTWTITDGTNTDTESGTALAPTTAGLVASAAQLTVGGGTGQVVFQGPTNVYLEYSRSLNNYDAAILGGLRAWIAVTTPTSLGGDPWIIARVATPSPILTLKVNGQHPTPPNVTTTGPYLLTLDMLPTTYTASVAWYWAIIVNDQVIWFTSSGVSTTPAPLLNSPPVVLGDLTLLDLNLPVGTSITTAFFLVNGSTLVGFDYIAATVVP